MNFCQLGEIFRRVDYTSRSIEISSSLLQPKRVVACSHTDFSTFLSFYVRVYKLQDCYVLRAFGYFALVFNFHLIILRRYIRIYVMDSFDLFLKTTDNILLVSVSLPRFPDTESKISQCFFYKNCWSRVLRGIVYNHLSKSTTILNNRQLSWIVASSVEISLPFLFIRYLFNAEDFVCSLNFTIQIHRYIFYLVQ